MADVYTEGVCHDGAAILRNGERLTITEILAALNAATPPADAALAERIDALEAVELLRGMVDANAAKWDMPHDEFCTEYMAWSKNRARAFLAKIDAEKGEASSKIDQPSYTMGWNDCVQQIGNDYMPGIRYTAEYLRERVSVMRIKGIPIASVDIADMLATEVERLVPFGTSGFGDASMNDTAMLAASGRQDGAR
jgi:hypothetical protein